MTRPGQLPSQRPFCIRVHVKIEPQMGRHILNKMKIESQAGRAYIASYIEKFELRHCCFDEVYVDAARANA